MKDSTEAGEQVEFSRQDVYEDYRKCYLQQCADVRPCRDDQLLKKAAQYLLREPDLTEIFTVFPFYQAATERCEEPSTVCRKHLSAFIRAAEMLETICVNLFLQPWKREIRTLKTFTGPFVYSLLPVLSTSTIQSVLASIGYLPYNDVSQSEFRLSADANVDRAMQMGFELLLARVECYHLLDIQTKDHLGPQEWLELLQRRGQPTKLLEHTEEKTMAVQKKGQKKKKKELDNKEVLQCLETTTELNPQPKPQGNHLVSVDQSIMEMQRTYPDLAFRGRPLLPDQPHKARNNISNNRVLCNAELNERDCIKKSKSATPTNLSEGESRKAEKLCGDNGRTISCNDKNVDVISTPIDSINSSFEGSHGRRVDDELSGPQAISLHITLRAGTKAEMSLKPGKPQSTTEPLAETQQLSDRKTEREAKPEFGSLSFVDKEQDLRELAERMEQLCVQGNKEDEKRGEKDTRTGRRQEEKKSSSERGLTEKTLRMQVMETALTMSKDPSRFTISSQSDQKQPTVGQPLVLTGSTADCKGDGSIGEQEGEDSEGQETCQTEEEHTG
ncbi:uncharacterized protein [Leuresthes tenuis]|uniref:uncharacterized protein isoform X1 n=1 Tax=Leuresthes tenuis TaxID=355514 RepID=UPI003B5112D2